MNFVLTRPWIQFSAGSTVVVIDQAWQCALKPAGNIWKKKTERKKEVAGEFSIIPMCWSNQGWMNFAKNRLKCACSVGAVLCSCLCFRFKVKLFTCRRLFKVNRNWRCVSAACRDRLFCCSWSVSPTSHTVRSVSTVNKHKPWIETSYHGVITENTDIVLLDPPLVALDKDAPIPYAGRVQLKTNACEPEHGCSSRGKGRMT